MSRLPEDLDHPRERLWAKYGESELLGPRWLQDTWGLRSVDQSP